METVIFRPVRSPKSLTKTIAKVVVGCDDQDMYGYDQAIFKKVRMTVFHSKNQQAFSSVWYPTDVNLPIFAVDLACFDVENQKSSCLINFIEPDKNKPRDLTPYKNIQKGSHLLPRGNSLFLIPYTEFLSDAMVYGSVKDLSRFSTDIAEVVHKYLEAYLEEIEDCHTNKKDLSPNGVKQRLLSIQKRIKYNTFRRKHIDIHFFAKDYFDGRWYRDMLEHFYDEDDNDDGDNEEDDNDNELAPSSCNLDW
jgi:hypothetical protein